MITHLWQSTIFALGCALFARVLYRKRSATVRYAIWLAAAAKFLVPFTLLTASGAWLGAHLGERQAPAALLSLQAATQPLMLLPPADLSTVIDGAGALQTAPWGVTASLVGLWFSGSAAVLSVWIRRWRHLSGVVHSGQPVTAGPEIELLRDIADKLRLHRPVTLVTADTELEPGIFGVLSPVLLWPRDIRTHLDTAHVEAIFTHELAHLRRRDHRTALVPIMAQTFFWFHPIVWWIGAQLLREREQACDEIVLDSGVVADVYAESILRTCRRYIELPVVFAGVTGSALLRRLEMIMRPRTPRSLDKVYEVVPALLLLLVLSVPIIAGALGESAPQSSPTIVSGGPEFDVATVRPSGPNDQPSGIRPVLPGGRFTAVGLTLKEFLRIAYGPSAALLPDQVVGGPDWLDKERFDIIATGSALADPNASPRTLFVMLQHLLAARFRVQAHVESRQLPVFALVLSRPDGRPGPRLRPTTAACRSFLVAPTAAQDAIPTCGFSRVGPGSLSGINVPMSLLGGVLAQRADVGRVVQDRTGLSGGFDLDLEFTPGAAAPNDNPNAPGLFTALQEQLGLRLESARGPVDVLVVDRAERPSKN